MVTMSKDQFLLLSEGGMIGPRAVLKEAQGGAFKIWYRNVNKRDHTHQMLVDLSSEMVAAVMVGKGLIRGGTPQVRMLLDKVKNGDSTPWGQFDAEEAASRDELDVYLPEFLEIMDRPLRKKWPARRTAGGGGGRFREWR